MIESIVGWSVVFAIGIAIFVWFIGKVIKELNIYESEQRNFQRKK